MATTRYKLNRQTVTQVSDGSAVLRLQCQGGYVRLYQGESAPTELPSAYLTLSNTETIGVAAGAMVWAWGDGDIVSISVE